MHDDITRARRARAAVYRVFAANGFLLATWASRLPAIREDLGLSPAGLGLVLVAVSVGALAGLPLSGPVVHRLGPSRTVAAAAVACAAGVAGAGLAGTLWLLVPVLFLTGLGNGLWDVAMNVEGAEVERRLGVEIMPRFHAAFSLGTVAGAGAGSAAAGLDVPRAVHLPVVALLGVAAALAAVRAFLPGDHVRAQPADGPRGGAGRSGTLQAWTEPRTLLIGLLVFGMGLSEGAANDWIAVGMVDDYAVGHATAAAGLGCFLAAMTLARFTGPWLLGRLGRVGALRAGALAVLAGVATFVAGSVRADTAPATALALAVAGVLAWGWGSALGFPVGMSAAADDPHRAAARVSVVATVGYTAFLAGPPLLGLLGDHVGVVPSLSAVAVAVALSFAVAGAARPLATSR